MNITSKEKKKQSLMKDKVSAYHDHIFELFSANGSSDSQTLESYNVQSSFWNQKISIDQKDFPSWEINIFSLKREHFHFAELGMTQEIGLSFSATKKCLKDFTRIHETLS